MTPMSAAVRTGISRGRVELRQTFTNMQDLWGYLFPTVILIAVMLFMRNGTVPGTDFSLGASAMLGVLGMQVATGGLMTVAQVLVIEREDGTLLRAKAIPHGMTGYLVSKVVATCGIIAFTVVIILIPGMLLFDGFTTGVGSWLTLVWVVLLGLIATVPLGATFGSLFPSPRSMGMGMFFPIMGLVGISGIFYPITALPDWLGWIGQIFPIYWLGLGMRSALLPDAMAAVEVGESWRHLATVGVLGAWAVLGLLLAPIVLRRMARRESGSSVAARREKAMQRVG